MGEIDRVRAGVADSPGVPEPRQLPFKAGTMLLSGLSKWRPVTIVGAVTALTCAGCPDPDGATRRFIDDRPPPPDMGLVPEGCTGPADRSGRWLIGVATVLDPSRALVFLGTVRMPEDGASIELDLQPLDAVTRTPVGEPWRTDPVPVAEDGTFVLTYGTHSAPGEANAISGAAITVDFALHGQLRSAGGLCGELVGALVQPVMFDITGSTWATVPGDGALAGLPLVTACPACADDAPGPAPEGGPMCPDTGAEARCDAACAWLADCAISADFCPALGPAERGRVEGNCLDRCAENATLAPTVCSQTTCQTTIDLSRAASPDFRLDCDGE